MIKAVVFDLDDTLISEHEYIQSGFTFIASILSEQYNLLQDDVFSQLMCLFKENSRNVFNRWLDLHQIEYTSEYIKELIGMYRNHIPNISLYKDAEFILKFLSEKNLKLGIITDGYKVTQRHKLSALNINSYFESIIVTDEIGRAFWKPHARAYELAKEQLGVEFNEMMYIGDNVSKDFITAKKLGIKTIHIKRDEGVYRDLKYGQEYMADKVINSLQELVCTLGGER